MTEQGKSRIDVEAGRIAYIRPPADLDDKFVDRIIDLAELLPDKSRRYVERQIRAQAQSYLTSKAIASRYLSAAEGRKALRQLDRSFGKIAATLDSLAVEQSLVLDAMIKKGAGAGDGAGLIVNRVRLDQLREAVAKTVEVYKPKTGNPALHQLEFAIGALMLLFEITAGKRVTVSMTRNGEHDPRSASPQADAIIQLMTGIDPSLDPRTVITKIDKISRAHRGKPLSRFAVALWIPMQPVQPIPAMPEKV